MASADAPFRTSIYSLIEHVGSIGLSYLERLGLRARHWVTRGEEQRNYERQFELASAASQRRLALRTPLQQAVTVQFTSRGHYQFTGVSRDISESGIYVSMESSVIEVGSHVEIMLTLPSRSAEPIPIHVKGRVVRIEQPSPAGFAVAFDTLVVAPSITDSHSQLQSAS